MSFLNTVHSHSITHEYSIVVITSTFQVEYISSILITRIIVPLVQSVEQHSSKVFILVQVRKGILLNRAHNLKVKWFLDEKRIEVQVFLGLSLYNNLNRHLMIRYFKANYLIILIQL